MLRPCNFVLTYFRQGISTRPVFKANSLLSINSRYKLMPRLQFNTSFKPVFCYCKFDHFKSLPTAALLNNSSKSLWVDTSPRFTHLMELNNFKKSTHFVNRKLSKLYHHNSSQISIFGQNVPKTTEEAKDLFNQSPISPPDSKILKVAIIGVPNSGKSTLINSLVGWRICSVSQKVHTTQCSAQAVYNSGSTQIVFLDTPGVVTPEEVKKYRLKHSLVVDPEISMQQADVVVVLHDVSNRYTRNTLNPRILRLLTLFQTVPSILILNKVDLLKNKTQLLSITESLTEGIVGNSKIEAKSLEKHDKESLRKSILEHVHDHKQQRTEFSLKEQHVTGEAEPSRSNLLGESEDAKRPVSKLDIENVLAAYEEESAVDDLNMEDVFQGRVQLTEKQVQKLIDGKKGWPRFQAVYMTSALEGLGIEDVSNYFLQSAKKGQWIFNDEVITSQSPQEIALLTVREKCLDHLSHNIPYELKFRVLYWDLSDSELLNILVGVYCNKKTYMKLLLRKVRRIAFDAEQDLRNVFRTEVKLRINCEYNPNVTESDF